MCLFVLSLSLSLSKVVTEQSAQNVMIFSPKKKRSKNDKRENFFNDTKKCHVCCFFASFAVPLTTRILMYSQHTTNNTNETEERNESKNDEKEYLFCTRVRVCVQKQCCATLFTNKEFFFFAGFLVSRECRILVKFDIIRISPRGERARFALNSKRNLRNVLDPVKRFFPRRWRL